MKLKNKKMIKMGITCCVGAAAFGLGSQIITLLSYLSKDDLTIIGSGVFGILLPLGVYSVFNACQQPIHPEINLGTESKPNSVAAKRPVPSLKPKNTTLAVTQNQKPQTHTSSNHKKPRKLKR